jgi:hypothetical protein
MKKIIIALAAVSAVAAGASAAQAHSHGHFNLYFGGYGGHYGHYNNYYSEPAYSDYQPECHYVTVKKVFWEYGYKIVKYQNKLVCNSY